MFRLLKKYPLQAILLLFNTGIFGYLQSQSNMAYLTEYSASDLSTYLPSWLGQLVGNSFTHISDFMSNSAWVWLVVSIILTLLIRFVKGLIKLILFLIILAGGIYLVWQNREILAQLM